MLITISLLIFLALIMLVMHWGRSRDIDPNLHLAERIERSRMLENAIFKSNRFQDNRRFFNLNKININVFRNSRFWDPKRLDHDLL